MGDVPSVISATEFDFMQGNITYARRYVKFPDPAGSFMCQIILT
jgi:hypothetical protein